jgi:ABC-type antimicrobial peptide transport system ATPase subunit
MAILDVSNLSTRFHTRNGIVHAVEDVSFSVDKGETLGIVGESGSGKSVSCYSLLGLIPTPPGKIHSGKAIFDGLDLLQASERQLRKIHPLPDVCDACRTADKQLQLDHDHETGPFRAYLCSACNLTRRRWQWRRDPPFNQPVDYTLSKSRPTEGSYEHVRAFGQIASGIYTDPNSNTFEDLP